MTTKRWMQQSTSTPLASNTTHASITPPSTATAPSQPPKPIVTSAAMSKPTTTINSQSNTATRKLLTLDNEVDTFLSGTSFRDDEDEPGALPLLRPQPLSIHEASIDATSSSAEATTQESAQDTDSVFQTCQELVRRRAWSDVVSYSMKILTSSQYEYETFYSQIVNSAETINLDGEEGEADGVMESPDKDESEEKHTDHVGQINIQNIHTNTPRSTLIQRRTIQILHWRMRAMIHLRRYADLKREVQSFNFQTSTLHKLQNECEKLGFPSLIMDAIHARQYTMAVSSPPSSISASTKAASQAIDIANEWNGCVDELYLLRKALEEHEDWKDLWMIHLYITLSNVYTRGQEWRMALVSLEKVLECIPQHVHSFVSRIKDISRDNGTEARSLALESRSMTTKQTTDEKQFVSLLSHSLRIQCYSRQGRILLQAGALPEAAIVFERAHDEYQSMKKDQKYGERKNIGDGETSPTKIASDLPMVRNAPAQILLNEGLLHFAHMDYELAEEKFQKGADWIRKNNSNITKNIPQMELERIIHQHCLEFECIFQVEEDLMEPCLNNLALCMLYKCRMKEAVDLMESLVRTDPTKFLTGTMAFNLCTLYELGSDNAVSEKKKKILQLVAKRFLLHDIGIECFRL